MRQPQRSQPSHSTRLSSGALSSTTLPKVLKDSTLLPSDIKRSTEGVAGEGILVKLFPVSHKHARSVGDSKQTLWIVGSPNASSGFPSKWEDAQKLRAKITQPTKTGSFHRRRANPKATSGTAKGHRPLARGERKPLMSNEREKGDGTETDDLSEEEEEEGGDGEEEDEDEEEEEGEAEDEESRDEEAGDKEAEEEEAVEEEAAEEEGEANDGMENHTAAKDVITERIVVEDDEEEYDTEEQGDDWHDREHEEAQAKEANQRGDREDQDEGDREKDQDDEEREKEEEGEQEVEDAGDKVEKFSKKKEKDGAEEDEQAEVNEDEDDKTAGEESGNHDDVQEDREGMEQRVAANNPEGSWRDCGLADRADKEEEDITVGSSEEERMAGEEGGDPKERRKRPLERYEVLGCSTPRDRPNKRSKSDGGKSEDGAATDDLIRRTFSPEATPRPRTPSPTFIIDTPGSKLEIVRQTSVVPGLENTEKAVWDAAQRDSIINSLPREQQTKMIHSALSLGSEEGIKELQRFVCNARKDGMRGSESLESGFNLGATEPDFTSGHANDALVLRDRSIAHFSTLYRHLDILDGKTTLFSIAKRAKLATMAQYRKSILPEGAGRKDIRSATLRLFHAVWPHHDTIEKPEDKATNPAAYADWIRLRDRLKEGRQWLAIRDLFGGDGAFLALPPQCVSDRDILKMPSKVLEAWLGLLDMAWKALDDRARQTLNNLVRLALAGQPFPEDFLALEILESGTGATPTSLSALLTGWSAAARNVHNNRDGAIATLMERKAYSDATGPETSSTATRITSRIGEAGNVEVVLQKDTMGDLSDDLFDYLDFDDYLSQEI
jgi:hypothetical protein